MKGFGRYIAVFFVGALLGGGGYFAFLGTMAFAQSTDSSASSDTTSATKAQLQAEYDQIEQEIAQYQQVIDQTKAKENTLQGNVTVLNAQIAKAQASINADNLTINQLAGEINDKQATVESLQQQISDGHDSLAKLLREMDQDENTSLSVLALSSADLSGFFSELDDIDAINSQLLAHFDQLRGVTTETQQEEDALTEQQNQEADALANVQTQQAAISQSKAQEAQLLAQTKGQESAYNTVLAQKQAEATQIEDALFNLRDTQGISFETALQYAQTAEQATGVDAAFILAILRQESDLGQNVGQCLLVNTRTGAGKGKNTGTPIANVMNPTRDVPPFLDITSALGIDPYSQVVSCPQSVGYGGAMGPSQFIPSTWTLYENRIEAATGDAVADPWNAQDAVMATALYMEDLGASAQTTSAERKAAAEYYAGSNWAVYGLSYAADVLSYAATYQQQINCITDVTSCN